MKNFEHLKETDKDYGDIEKIDKNEIKLTFPLKNGGLKECYLDKDGQPAKFFVKNKKGDILEFVDLKLSKIDYINFVKNRLAQQGIVLTDDEINKVAKTILSDEFYKNFDEFDAVEH